MKLGRLLKAAAEPSAAAEHAAAVQAAASPERSPVIRRELKRELSMKKRPTCWNALSKMPIDAIGMGGAHSVVAASGCTSGEANGIDMPDERAGADSMASLTRQVTASQRSIEEVSGRLGRLESSMAMCLQALAARSEADEARDQSMRAWMEKLADDCTSSNGIHSGGHAAQRSEAQRAERAAERQRVRAASRGKELSRLRELQDLKGDSIKAAPPKQPKGADPPPSPSKQLPQTPPKLVPPTANHAAAVEEAPPTVTPTSTTPSAAPLHQRRRRTNRAVARESKLEPIEDERLDDDLGA